MRLSPVCTALQYDALSCVCVCVHWYTYPPSGHPGGGLGHCGGLGYCIALLMGTCSAAQQDVSGQHHMPLLCWRPCTVHHLIALVAGKCCSACNLEPGDAGQ